MNCNEVKNKLDIGFDTGELANVIQYMEIHLKTCNICQKYADKLNNLHLYMHVTNSLVVPKADMLMRIQTGLQERSEKSLPATRLPGTYHQAITLLLVLIGLSVIIYSSLNYENLTRLYEPSTIYTSISSITLYLSDHVYLLFYNMLHTLDKFWAVLTYYSTWQGPRIWVGITLSLILLIAINSWEWHKGGITNKRSL